MRNPFTVRTSGRTCTKSRPAIYHNRLTHIDAYPFVLRPKSAHQTTSSGLMQCGGGNRPNKNLPVTPPKGGGIFKGTTPPQSLAGVNAYTGSLPSRGAIKKRVKRSITTKQKQLCHYHSQH